jgi:hypothetical protein
MLEAPSVPRSSRNCRRRNWCGTIGHMVLGVAFWVSLFRAVYFACRRRPFRHVTALRPGRSEWIANAAVLGLAVLRTFHSSTSRVAWRRDHFHRLEAEHRHEPDRG